MKVVPSPASGPQSALVSREPASSSSREHPTDFSFDDLLTFAPEASSDTEPEPFTGKVAGKREPTDPSDPTLLGMLPLLSAHGTLIQQPPPPPVSAAQTSPAAGFREGDSTDLLADEMTRPREGVSGPSIPKESAHTAMLQSDSKNLPPPGRTAEHSIHHELTASTPIWPKSADTEIAQAFPSSDLIIGTEPTSGADFQPPRSTNASRTTAPATSAAQIALPPSRATAVSLGGPAAQPEQSSIPGATPAAGTPSGPADLTPEFSGIETGTRLVASDTSTSATALESAPPTKARNPEQTGPTQPATFSASARQLGPKDSLVQVQFRQDTVETPHFIADGTPVAMQRRAMSDYPQHQLSQLTPGALAGPSTEGTEGLGGIPSALEKATLPTADRQSPTRHFEVPDFPVSAVQIPPTNSAPGTFQSGDAELRPSEFHLAAQCLHRTWDLAERVNATGDKHVEVQMRLNDGHEVTVSLRLRDGEWKPTFKTNTDALCQALEQSWQQTATHSSSRPVRFGTPVFESLQLQAGLGEGTTNHSNGREQTFSHREREAVVRPTKSRNHPVSAPARPGIPARSSGIYLYA